MYLYQRSSKSLAWLGIIAMLWPLIVWPSAALADDSVNKGKLTISLVPLYVTASGGIYSYHQGGGIAASIMLEEDEQGILDSLSQIDVVISFPNGLFQTGQYTVSGATYGSLPVEKYTLGEHFQGDRYEILSAEFEEFEHHTEMTFSIKAVGGFQSIGNEAVDFITFGLDIDDEFEVGEQAELSLDGTTIYDLEDNPLGPEALHLKRGPTIKILERLPEPAFVHVILSTDKKTYYAGEEVSVTVSLSGITNAVPDGIIGVSVNIDPDLLDSDDYTVTDFTGLRAYSTGHMALGNEIDSTRFELYTDYIISGEPGIPLGIRPTGAAVDPLTADEIELFTFKLKVPENAQWSTSLIKIVDVTIEEGVLDEDGFPLIVDSETRVKIHDPVIVERAELPAPIQVSLSAADSYNAGEVMNVKIQVDGSAIAAPSGLSRLDVTVLFDRNLFTVDEFLLQDNPAVYDPAYYAVGERISNEEAFLFTPPQVSLYDASRNAIQFSIMSISEQLLPREDFVLAEFQIKVSDDLDVDTTTSLSIASVTARDHEGSPLFWRLIKSSELEVNLHRLPSSSRSFTSFSVDNVTGIIDEAARTITVNLPTIRNLSDLALTFVHTGVRVVADDTTITSGQRRSVASPVILTVVAENGETADYTLIVHNPPSSFKSFNSFSILDVEATAEDLGRREVVLIVPEGSDLTDLVAVFSFIGEEVTVNGNSQVSGVTANDYSQGPIVYTVHAEDRSVITYNVTVQLAPSSAKQLLTFAVDGVEANIDATEQTIEVILPAGANLEDDKTITFTVSPLATVRLQALNGIILVDGQSYGVGGPLSLFVIAEDGTHIEYTLSVSVAAALSDAKDFQAFAVDGHAGVITDNHILIILPSGTDLVRDDLPVSFTVSEGATVMNGLEVVTEGEAFNFSNILLWTVHAENGTTKDYTIEAVVASTEKTISSISVDGHVGEIDASDDTILVTLPVGESLTVTRPVVFEVSPYAVVRWGSLQGAVMESGQGLYDVSGPVHLFVIAQDGPHREYVLTVRVAEPVLSSENDFLTFRVAGISGEIDGENGTVSVVLPHGYVLGSYPISFTASAHATVTYGQLPIASGSSVMYPFATPQQFTIIAQNGDVKTYTVTVTVAAPPPSNAKQLTSFVIDEINVAGVIQATAKTVMAHVKYGTDVTKLIPSFTHTGKLIYAGGELQQSGISVQNFTLPVEYTVYAEDGSFAVYTVTVVIGAPPVSPPSGYVPPYTPPSPPIVGEKVGKDEGQAPPEQEASGADTRFGNPERTLKIRNDMVSKAAALLQVMQGSSGLQIDVRFSDIEKHWSGRNIELFARLGMVRGYEDGTFRPDAQITRAEFAVLVMGIFQLSSGREGNTAFNDTTDHWARAAIEALKASGAISGYEDGTFRPDNEISRAEIVTILSHLVNLSDINARKQFGDTTAHWAEGAISRFAGAGVVNGRNDNTFDPDAKATRGEAITILINILNLDPVVAEALAKLFDALGAAATE